MEYTRTGTGPTVFLLPGLGCDQRMWEEVAARLEDRFTLVVPHLWGSGSLAQRADALEALAGQLGRTPVGLAGLSMGGYLALECLRRWPQGVRAAALLDTTAFPDPPERVATRHQVLGLLEAGAYRDVLGAFVPSVLAPDTPADAPARRLLLEMAADLGPETFGADLRAILERGDYRDVLPKIRVPTLFLAGEHDALTPPATAREMAAQVPGSRVVEVPGAGHMAPLEDPAATAGALGSFFGAALPR